MTIGQKRRYNSVNKRKSFMNSDKQEAKKHAAAQRLLFQMSDVQGELHKKKQQAASRKEHAAELQRKKQRICAEAYDQPHIRCRQRNKMIEESALVVQKNVISIDSIKERGNADAEFNHLLMLANSAELLESEGQFDVEKLLEDTDQIGAMEIERGDFRFKGKVRLTHIRQRARLRNPLREHADFERSKDTHGDKSATHYQNVQGVMHHQNVQDSCVVTKRGSEGIKDNRKQAFVAKLKTINTDNIQQSSVNEPMNINNRNLQQSSCRTHVIASQPVQRDSEFVDLEEQGSGAHPLKEAATAEVSLSEENKFSENLQQPALELPVPQAVQMTSELGLCWEQHNSAYQLTKFTTTQVSGSKEDNLSENLQQPPAGLHVCVSQPEQMTPELGDCGDQDSGSHILTEVGTSRMSLLKEKNLYTQLEHGHEPFNNLIECASSMLQISEVVKNCDYTARCKGKSKRPPVVWMPKVLKDDTSVARHRRMLRITQRRKNPVQKSVGLKHDPSVARHRRMLRITKQREKAVHLTTEVGERRGQDSGAHPLMEVGTANMSNPKGCFPCENLQKEAVELYVTIPPRVQMTSELQDFRGQGSGAHPLMEVVAAKMSNPKGCFPCENLQKAVELHATIPPRVQMASELQDLRGQDASAHPSIEVGSSKMSNPQKEAVELHATIPPRVQMTSELQDLGENQNRAHQLTEARTYQISLSNEKNLNENLQQASAELCVGNSLPVQMTAELGDYTEKNNYAHLLTEAGNSKMSSSIEKNVNPLIPVSEVLKDGDSNAHRKGRRKRLPVVHVSEDLKDDPSIKRHKRTLRIIERRKQRHGAQSLSTANIHTRPVCQGHHWGLCRDINELQYERSHGAKQQWPSNVSHAETDQYCLTTQQNGAERIQDQGASKTSLQQSNICLPMEQSRLEDRLHNSRMAVGAEQASLSLKVDQSLQHHCEDLCDELQQRITNLEAEDRTSVKPKMRLTLLKREARLKYSPLQMKN